MSAQTATVGDNFGTGEEAFRNELTQFEEDCARLAKGQVDERTEGRVADLVNREKALRKTATTMKDNEKRPFLDETNRIDAAFRGVVGRLAGALETPRAMLKAYLIEQQRKHDEAARRAAQEAAAKAAEAAELRANEDPFERFNARDKADTIEGEALEASRAAAQLAAAKVRVASSTGRAVGLKNVKDVEIVDYDTALLHFAENPGVREAVHKAAFAIAKATQFKQPIPGVKFVDRKELA